MTDAKADSKEYDQVDILNYDFSKIDYELDRANSIGRGLWSNVYFAQPIVRSPVQDTLAATTPPPTPQQRSNNSPCSLYAIKVAARPDAKQIFHQEARMLTVLQRSEEAHEHIVPFYGLDERISVLVFEGVDGGSLENLVARLKTMTELERHLELRSLFGKLSSDLIGGLHFIHSKEVVHADIKPANVLLDLVKIDSSQAPIVRARYIDFSASFITGSDSSANAGGTWDFMAPEQLSRDKNLNTPTFKSDIWSLGITLLYLLVGASPYYAVRDSMIRVREAIKDGTPLVYARSDPTIQKRMATCQDFVDSCRLALQKDIARRPSTAGWKAEVQKTLLPAQT
jgi:serine/threonine protein kinase